MAWTLWTRHVSLLHREGQGFESLRAAPFRVAPTKYPGTGGCPSLLTFIILLMNTLDYFAPFAYFFQDKDWLKKFVLASLLTYTLIGAAPMLGWTIEIVRRVAKNAEPLIPDFVDWKSYWRLGGQFAFVNAVWLLPVLLAVILLYLPLIFASRLQGETLLVVWGSSLACVLVFLFIYSILYGLFFPAMQVVLAETGSSRQAAHPVRLWKTVRQNPGAYLIVFLFVGLALLNVTLVAAALTAFLLLPPLLVYASLVSAHFAGQLMRMGKLPT
jgi:Protein of unknown function (DUF4013)